MDIKSVFPGRGDLHGTATRFRRLRSLRSGLPVKEGDLWTQTSIVRLELTIPQGSTNR